MHSASMKKHIFRGCGDAGKLADEKSCKLGESKYFCRCTGSGPVVDLWLRVHEDTDGSLRFIGLHMGLKIGPTNVFIWLHLSFQNMIIFRCSFEH